MGSGFLGASVSSTDKPLDQLQCVFCTHKVGTLAWFLKGCSGTTKNGLSQLPGPMWAALFRGFLGPALGRMSHVVEMSEFCLARCHGLSQVASYSVFSGWPRRRPTARDLGFGHFEEFRSCPELFVPSHHSASFSHLWGQNKLCLEKSMLWNNDSNGNNVNNAFYQL